MNIHTTRFPEVRAALQNTPVTWHACTAEDYDEMLGGLPPAAWHRGAFLVGEASDHSHTTGAPRFQCYRHRGDVYEASGRPMTHQEFKEAFGNCPCY